MRAGVREDLRHTLLVRQSGFAAIELARKRGSPEAEADRCARRHRGSSDDGPEPARPQGHDVRPLCSGLVEDAGAQRGRGRRCLGRICECAGSLGELRKLVVTARAMRQVCFVTARVLWIEGVERVRGGQVV